MQNHPAHKILLADDDPGVSKSLEMVLISAGYDVSTAAHDIDAILLLQKTIPDVLIYELNLPHVPGYNFLTVVRKRLPQVGVIAISSSWNAGGSVPDGVLADGFYAKGQSGPEKLLGMIGDLIRTSAARTRAHREEMAQIFARNLRTRIESG